MGTESQMLVPVRSSSGGPPSTGDVSLGFALNFMSGRGLLTTRERQIGPWLVRSMSLEIPNIAFPFDVSGGADRFKPRRCILRHLALCLNQDGIDKALAAAKLAENGLRHLKVALFDGYLVLAGEFSVGEVTADFTCRAALLPAASHELQVVFYDTRVYGWLPLSAGLLPVYLRRALLHLPIDGRRAGAWVVRPVERFVREILPRCGWKIPDMREAYLVAADVTRGQVNIFAGPSDDPTPRQIAERSPPAAAVAAADGIATHAEAEEALAQGAVGDAYRLWRDALDEGRAGAWVRDRLLQIGTADPELTVETRQLADEILARDPEHVGARLALAAIAGRERAWTEAAEHYALVAVSCRERKERFDWMAAELAAGRAAAPVDKQRALQSFERAAARAGDSPAVFEQLFALRLSLGEYAAAAEAGERWLTLVHEGDALAALHCRLGQLYLAHLHDFKRARLHFEKALRHLPDASAALEGLAETYAARGEPGRAAAYLSRLAEQAELSKDAQRIAALNLRLGDIWQKWLHDLDNAAARYQRVLDVQPRHVVARLQLAGLAEAREDWARARLYYQDIVALDDEQQSMDDPAPWVAAYVRLAQLLQRLGVEPLEVANHLQRAMELDPHDDATREELLSLLRRGKDWGRLVRVLDDTARTAQDPQLRRTARLEAARVELQERRSKRAARLHLEQILAESPADTDALTLLVPLLESQNDGPSLTAHLQRAALATANLEYRADLFYRLATLQSVQGQTGEGATTRLAALEAALAANPSHGAAARALVELVQAQSPEPEVLAKAYAHLAAAAPPGTARAQAHCRRAEVLLRQVGDADEARAAAELAVREDPQLEEAYLLLGDILESQGDARAARQALEQGRRHLGEQVTMALLARLADLAKQAGDTAAEADYLSMMIQSPEATAEHRARYADVLVHLGRDEEAAEAWERWGTDAVMPPGEAFLRAGQLRAVQGETATARALLRRALDAGGGQAAAAALENAARSEGLWKDVAAAISAQLKTAASEQEGELLTRLLAAQLQGEDGPGAEATSARLVERAPQSVLAHQVLAHKFEARGQWDRALDHYLYVLLVCPADQMTPMARRQAFIQAAGIALEIRVNAVPALREAFAREFPDAPAGVLAEPIGTRLLAQKALDKLVALRQLQLPGAPPAQALAYRRELAELLHRHLHRSAEAIPYYQEVAGADLNDVAAREALAEIYTRQGRWLDLAHLQFGLSQLIAEPEQALAAALQCAELYTDVLEEPETAVQCLRTFLDRPDVPLFNTALFDMLERVHMHADLAQLLENSLSQDADPDDGRFEKLCSLLAGPLRDPTRALEWVRRMIEAFPDADRARRVSIELLRQHPSLGDPTVALREWADARQGPVRGEVLRELAAHLHHRGDARAAMAALEAAYQSQPDSILIIEQLIERSTAHGDFTRLVHWLQVAAALAAEGAERDARLRRIIEVTTDIQPDGQVAKAAILGLSHRTGDDVALLVQLYRDDGDYLALAQFDDLSILSDDVLLWGARAAGQAGELAVARRYLEAALARGQVVESAWELAGELFAGQLLELGRWRLQFAKQAPGTHGRWLRFVAHAELLRAGEPPAGVTTQTATMEMSRADFDQPTQAWAVFYAARLLNDDHWRDRAAQALEEVLADEDPRLLPVLRARVAQELNGGDSAKAVAAAQRLVALGDAEAADWLERALVQSGRDDELIELLRRRADKNEEDAPELWTRLAALYLRHQDTGAAGECLARVESESRTKRWGEVQYSLGASLGDAALMVAGAQVSAAFCVDRAERAALLRHAAAGVRAAGSEAAARPLLMEAQTLVPWTAQDVLKAAAELPARDRGTRLHEGLAILDAKEHAPLWLALVEWYDDIDETEANRALARAAQAAHDQATQLRAVAMIADARGAANIGLQCRRRLYALEPEQEAGAFSTALRVNERWEELVDLLEDAADQQEPSVGAMWLDEACERSRQQLMEAGRALRAVLRANRLAPTPARQRTALDLAVAERQPDVVLEMAQGLAEAMPSDDADLGYVLRQLLHAQMALHDAAGALATRARLVAAGLAEADDVLALADSLVEEEPQRAAKLFEKAAEGFAEPTAQRRCWLAASRAYQAASDAPAAVRTLRTALTVGPADADTYCRALELFTEPADRLPAATALLRMQGDAPWPAARRAALRLEVAAAHVATGDTSVAAALLAEAGTLDPTPAWAALYERVLQASNDAPRLLTLWLDHANLWEGNERSQRLVKAAQLARQVGTPADEMRALVATNEQDSGSEQQDRLLELCATLQDRERFTTLLARRYAATAGSARVALALRVAALWVQHFNDQDKAASLLHEALALSTEPAVLDALYDLHVTQLGRPLDYVNLLRQRAGAASTPAADRVALLVRAGDVAAAHDVSGAAFAIYLEVVRLDSSMVDAADYCLEHGRRLGQWAEVLEVLDRRARAAGDLLTAARFYNDAADVARDGLSDPDQELTFLQAAVDRDPTPERCQRLVLSYLQHGDARQAADWLQHERLGHDAELELGLRTVAMLGDAGESLMGWLAERHPQAPEAIAHRLRQARATGDLEAVQSALLARLQDSGLSLSERARLHLEAADVALELRQYGSAVTHWLDALDGPDADVAWVVKAAQVAEASGDESLRTRVLQRAQAALGGLIQRLSTVPEAERALWHYVVAQIYEDGGEDASAAESYQQVIQLERKPPERAIKALQSLYSRYGEWQQLANLYEHIAEHSVQPAERGELYYQLGCLWRDRLVDEEKAAHYFGRALQAAPDMAAAHLAYGLILANRNRFSEALTHLEGRVDLEAETTQIEHMVALFQCYRASGMLAEAIDLTGLLLAREPDRASLRMARAEMLEEAARYDEARAEMQQYLQTQQEIAPPDVVAGIHQRIGTIAAQQGDTSTALQHLEESYRLGNSSLALLTQLRQSYEQQQRWEHVAELRGREVALLQDTTLLHEHYLALADIYDTHLDDRAKATAMLECAADVAPRDAALLQRLLDRYDATIDRAKYLLCAERLLNLQPEGTFDAAFFARLAAAYEPVDAVRAKDFYTRALTLDPGQVHLRSKQREMALAAGDYSTFAPNEEEALRHVTDPAEKARRYSTLADVYLQQLNDVEKAVAALTQACSAAPGEGDLWRRLADTYALDERFYEKAMELYRRLLAAAPLDADMLRIVARLAGQMGHTDRAYGYYACLLAVLPGDDEAERFVQACRNARPAWPPRALNDAERSQGINHQHQGGPIEDLFAPLARFAELTHSGDLTRRGITPRDKLPADDANAGPLLKLIGLLGLTQSEAYRWAGGGAACDIELLNPPALLLGSQALETSQDRRAAFLSARAAELYRSGHTLCERLHPPELQALIGALCVAVDSSSKPPGLRPESARWAQVIAAPMTVQIRAAMAPRVAAYLKAAGGVDVNRWRVASVATANRVALIMACDIDEALNALLAIRGFELDHAPRGPVLREAYDELELFRFAQSDAFFNARQALGIALRPSK